MIIAAGAMVLRAASGGADTIPPASSPASAADSASGATPPTPETSSPTPAESPSPAPGPPSSALRLHLVDTITGNLSPKSVVSSQTGLFFVQNMMYRHTVAVYDRERELV